MNPFFPATARPAHSLAHHVPFGLSDKADQFPGSGKRCSPDILPWDESQQTGPHRKASRAPRWTKRNDESFYGYKNHLGVDKAHKLIRKWDATDAAVHDSQKLDDEKVSRFLTYKGGLFKPR